MAPRLSFSLFPLLMAGLAVLLAGSAEAMPWYHEVADEIGIDFQHAGWMHEDHNPWFPEITPGGVCWFDHDGDGWLDIFFVNARYYDEELQDQTQPTSHLYRNQGDGTFVDVSQSAGLDRGGFWDLGCSAADYDADGWVDLFISSYDDDVLYRNNGDGTFTDVSASSGVQDTGLCGSFPCWGHSSSWVDYDNDGWLDLYVTNYVEWNQTIHTGNGPRQYHGQRNLMWHNEGDGTFLEVSELTNTTDDPQPMHGKGMGVVWYDHDMDGCMDAYIASDQAPASLLHNDCAGHFEDIAAAAYVNDNYSGMGTVAGDTSGDGWPDLYKTHYQGEPNSYYVNARNGTYEPHTHEGGLASDMDHVGWGTGFFDFDNDGDLDIYAANGHTEFIEWDILTVHPWEQNRLWFNDGNGSFEDVTDMAGPGWGLKEVTRGSAVADYDRDGDLDVAFNNIANATADVLRAANVTGPEGRWSSIELLDPTAPNWQAIGARVDAFLPGGARMTRHVMAGSGYLSQDQTALHFGLGEHGTVEFTVHWPDGVTETFPGLDADRHLRLVRGGEVVEDLLAPVTRLVAPHPDGWNGWHVGPVEIELTAEDRGLTEATGVDSTLLRVGTGPWEEATRLMVGTDGTTEIAYRSVDHAGNEERTHRHTVRIDATPPVTSAVIDGEPGAGEWIKGPAALRLSAKDDVSGVGLTEYRIGNGPWQAYSQPVPLPDGTWTISYRSQDQAGNLEDAQGRVVRVDGTPPATTITANGIATDPGWFTGPAIVDVHVVESTSGVAETFIREDAGSWVPFGGPWTLQHGIHEIQSFSRDRAGNDEAPASRSIKVDAVPPVVTGEVLGTRGDGNWIIDAPRLSALTEDDLSGPDSTRYRTDGGEWIEVSDEEGPVALPDGTYLIELQGKDVAGHLSPIEAWSARIDTLAPTLTDSTNGTMGENGWWASEVGISWDAGDETSGVYRLEHKLGAGEWSEGDQAFLGDGIHTAVGRVFDHAGHVTYGQPIEVKVDTAAPVTSARIHGTPGLDGWYVTAVDLELAAEDATSDVHRIEYQVVGADASWNMYESPVSFQDGVHVVAFRAIDHAGNQEPVQEVTVRVDSVAPSIHLEVDGMHRWDESILHVVSSTKIRLLATDDTSGVARVEHDVGDGWTIGHALHVLGDDGTRPLAYVAADAAGNQAPVDHQTLRLMNSVPPPLQMSSRGELDPVFRQVPTLPGGTAPDLYSGCIVIRADSGDHVSGTARLELRIDGQAVASRNWDSWSSQGRSLRWTWNSLAAAPGPHVISGHAFDHLGNEAVIFEDVLVIGAGVQVPAICPDLPPLSGAIGFLAPIAPVQAAADVLSERRF